MCINYYLEQYRKSFYSLIKNPIVLVPDILLLAIGIFFTFGALSITGIPSLLSQAAAIATKSELSAFFSSFIKTNIVKLSITVIAFLFTMFIIGTGTIAVKLSMIHDISKNKKPTIMGAWISSRKYFWRIIGMRILVFLAYLVSLIIGIIILGVLSFVHEILAVILALLSIILLSIIIMLGFYMRYPILYSKNLPALETLKNSYCLFKANKEIVIITAIIISLTLFLIQVVFSIIAQPSGSIASFIVVPEVLAMLIGNVATTIFLFNVCCSMKKVRHA